jgi:hypothetical protein
VRGSAFGLALLAGAIATAGCAGIGPPAELVAAAESSLQRAEEANAQRYAPLELYQAREKLEEAKTALRAERHAEARRLAEQASVQAELAEALAETGRTRRSADQLRQSVQALEAELRFSMGEEPKP